MPGRIRTIKPELMEDSAVARLSSDAFRVFVGMILLADDHGNLRASPGWLFGQVFHERGPTVSVDDALAELAAKLVTLYEVDGQRYAHINGWHKHQRIDNAQEPRVPLPPGWEVERIEWVSDKRKRSRWVSRIATVASTSTRNLPPWQTATDPDRRNLPPPDHDHDHDHDREVEVEPKRAAPPPASEEESHIRAALMSSPLLSTAEGVEASAAGLAMKVRSLPPECRWSDLRAEADEWVAHARKAFQSARDGGQHWSAERALAEVESKAGQRIRYRPKDARLERERERARSAQWPDGSAKSPAAIETDSLDAEIAEADRRLAAERAKRASEPKADPREMAKLTAGVLAKWTKGAA